jgi:hypothetical protein
VTRGLIPVIERISASTGGVARTYLCSRLDHHASTYGDKGWGCGYRNLQMLLSALVANPEYAALLSPHQVTVESSPSISRLQVQQP